MYQRIWIYAQLHSVKGENMLLVTLFYITLNKQYEKKQQQNEIIKPIRHTCTYTYTHRRKYVFATHKQ